MTEPLEKLEKILSQHTKYNENKIGIAMSDKILLLNTADIIYCEASSAYANAYLKDNKKILASKPLGDFEALLLHHRFFRIHHTCLIDLN